jgi:gluconokinase
MSFKLPRYLLIAISPGRSHVHHTKQDCRVEQNKEEQLMNYYIGIDIGTTATKTIAFSDTGTIMANQSIGYEMLHPQPDWSEQDPDAILQAVMYGLAQVMKTMAPDAPAFIAFSAAMHSLLVVDEAGKPLSNCIIWADNRADQLATTLRNSKTGEDIYQLTGVPIHCMSPLCKLLWLKEQTPLLFQAAYKFIGIK